MAKEVDYGPLTRLIGLWKGDKGMDVAPIKPQGRGAGARALPREENPFRDVIHIEAVGDVTNAEEEVLAIVRYHQSVFRKSNGEQFHDELGYWIWNASRKIVIQSLLIPRAVGLLAGGRVTERKDSVTFKVAARLQHRDWGILQSPFMRKKARTLGFRRTVVVKGDSMTYSQLTELEIYGKRFRHTDENMLTRT